MIKQVSRKQVNTEKYDICVANSQQSKIGAFSWYLDIVCDNWDVLVLDDYKAVMPIPWRKKMFVKYVYPPLWTMPLGVFSEEVVDESEFLSVLFQNFKYVELSTNSHNNFSLFPEFQKERTLQFIRLGNDYDDIYKKYNRNRKRELTKAKKYDLTERWNESPQKLIEIFKKNVGKRIRKIKPTDYDKLLKLMQICTDKRVGELLCVYDKDTMLVAAAFFLKYNNCVTELVCSSNFSNRKNGANTFMNDRAIFKYQPHFKIFNFGGSSMKNIKKYYLSFGATNEKYQLIKQNKLPVLLRLFKR